MGTAEPEPDSWVSATLDYLLSILGFTLIWYPLLSVGNAALGAPASVQTVNVLVGVLAFGGAYPVVAGDWSIGRLGEYVFVFFASALGWGLVGMVVVLASGVSLSGSSAVPQAVVWVAASLTAYLVVYRSQRYAE